MKICALFVLYIEISGNMKRFLGKCLRATLAASTRPVSTGIDNSIDVIIFGPTGDPWVDKPATGGHVAAWRHGYPMRLQWELPSVTVPISKNFVMILHGRQPAVSHDSG